MVLVLVPHSKLLWISFLDHFVRHLFTDSLNRKEIRFSKCKTRSNIMCVAYVISETTYSIYFIEDLPLLIWDSQLLCCLDGAPQLACPYFQVRQAVLLHKTFQRCRKLMKKHDSEIELNRSQQMNLRIVPMKVETMQTVNTIRKTTSAL